VDVASRTVGVGNQSLEADYIVIALGAELVPELIPGLAEASFSVYAFEDAKRLRDALVRVQGGSIAVVVSALPYKCPGAPHEAAMLLANDFRRRGLKDKVTVHLYTPEPQPMPVAGPQLGEAVTRMLASKGVVFHPLHKLTAVDANARKLHFDGKDPASYDMLIAIPPHRGSAIVREAGLANEAGWIPVDRFTFETKHERIYAIGDITTVAIPGRWKADVPMMLPKAGVFAHQQGSVVARRIADAIRGAAPETRFGGSGYCMLEAGEDLAGFAFGDFYAEPTPRLELREVGKAWHLGKVLFEQWWLSPLGVR
jgi:sulfide:quinone oxidoreductase